MPLNWEMFSKLHLSIWFRPCSYVVIHALRLEILKVNVQDLPQKLKLLLQYPSIRKLMFHQDDIAVTFFFLATKCGSLPFKTNWFLN